MSEFSFGYASLDNVSDNSSEGGALSESLLKKRHELEKIATDVLYEIIELSTTLTGERLDKRAAVEEINSAINQEVLRNKLNLSYKDKLWIVDHVMDDIYGYGPITSLINDSTVTEIMVNGTDKIFVERNGKIVQSEYSFRDDNHIMHTIDKIIAPIGRRVDESSPMVDARLPDGSRVNIIIPPLAIHGPSITIRKFSVDPYKLHDLMDFGTLNSDMAKILEASVKGRMNIIVAGGTGSGKTTLLNVISGFIPSSERIVTIEDSAELQLQQGHIVSLESRPANIEGKGSVGIRELVINSLRMRPDRIIVGEVRGGETLDMLQAMNTGHDGSITTIHSNSPRDTLSRIETMVLMSGMNLPSRAIREQIASGINIIVFCARFTDGSRKITNITEIVGMQGDIITLQDLYVYKQEGFGEGGEVLGRHEPTGIVPNFLEKIKAYGETIPVSVFDTKRRL